MRSPRPPLPAARAALGLDVSRELRGRPSELGRERRGGAGGGEGGRQGSGERRGGKGEGREGGRRGAERRGEEDPESERQAAGVFAVLGRASMHSSSGEPRRQHAARELRQRPSQRRPRSLPPANFASSPPGGPGGTPGRPGSTRGHARRFPPPPPLQPRASPGEPPAAPAAPQPRPLGAPGSVSRLGPARATAAAQGGAPRRPERRAPS